MDAGTQTNVADTAIRYRSGGVQLYMSAALAVCFAGVGILFLVLGVTSSRNGSPNPQVAWVIGSIFLLLCVGLLVAALIALRPVRLNQNELRIPNILTTTVIPLADIAGIGMLFRKQRFGTRRPSAWYAFVWRPDSSLVRAGMSSYSLKRFVTPNDPAAKPRAWAVKGSLDGLLSTDFGALESSPTGKMAKDLYERVLRAQGPGGKLSTLHFQKRPYGSLLRGSSLTGYWSPDGEYGKTVIGSH